MTTGSRMEDERFQVDPPVRQRTAMQSCLIGCLIVFLVMSVLALIAGYVVYRNWRGWTADVASRIARDGIDQSQLPAQEKQEVLAQIDRITDAFRTNKMSVAQFQKLVDQLSNSPLMMSIIASAMETKYIAKSGLNAEEKAQATQTLRRFLRGNIDGKIDAQGRDLAMAQVADKQPDGNWKLREQVSDEELRKFLEIAKAEADKANIPDEPNDFDPSEELKRIVDDVLKP